ncbi:hypothetical protein CBE01nite_18980 [Clostridium beijerinckii]|uniref:Uncharacterized protein n=1 Tax=Clostridium beijerinckii TaxID=1520 RepID=A0AB74V9R6_CLOBE|nr:hypothetical protein [Clostridium beijerinckii]NRZ27325.1 hypothetical protein [Clostridium beijerinckii]NYB96883.1 hypothetical protein [Clostridium beijerinckii]OOM22324.1 hypothetical protein CLBEI_33270 [Clostridium beijerinckii]QUN33173.1 hypothetical protein KEC93_14330 [Clostridium beijerinckii]SQB11734.1 Uncharacterised protein [Clostridium beijerinckii]
MYYEKIEEFIKKYRWILYLLSPSFAVYNHLKDEKSNINWKVHNGNLSNLMKALYLSLTIFILTIFSISDLKNIVNANPEGFSGSKLAFLIINIIMAVLCWRSISFKNKYLKEIKEYILSKSKILYVVIKNIEVIYILAAFTLIFTYICNEDFRIASVEMYMLAILVYFYGVSRPIHFFLVFVPDLIVKMEKNKKKDEKGRLRLVIIAVLSYVNIILDYVVLYYVLNIFVYKYFNGINIFDNNIGNIIDMLYYTTDCDTLLANNSLMKFYSVILKLSSAVLITGNLALYISMGKETNLPDNQNDDDTIYYI